MSSIFDKFKKRMDRTGQVLKDTAADSAKAVESTAVDAVRKVESTATDAVGQTHQVAEKAKDTGCEPRWRNPRTRK